MVKIVIKRNSNKIKVQDVKRRVIIKDVQQNIKINAKAKRGLPGTPGADGQDGAGVPTGGLPGQTLVKHSTTDFDTEWSNVDGSDKYYIQNFITTSNVLVTHNLAKYPSVTVHDSSGDEVEGNVEHININSLTVTFSAPFSGNVTCN